MNLKTNLKIITYATKMRLKGYKLLKNPKGTPSTEVNMLRHRANFYINTLGVDKFERVKKDFANSSNGYKKSLNRYQFAMPWEIHSSYEKAECAKKNYNGFLGSKKDRTAINYVFNPTVTNENFKNHQTGKYAERNFVNQTPVVVTGRQLDFLYRKFWHLRKHGYMPQDFDIFAVNKKTKPMGFFKTLIHNLKNNV